MSHNLYEDDVPLPRRRRLSYVFLVFLIIIGMLSSAIFAFYWFVSRSSVEQVSVPTVTVSAMRATEEPELDSAVIVEEATKETLAPEATATRENLISIDRIAYVKPNGQVATVGSDGQNERLLTEGSAAYQFPAWSPNGQYLAVIGGDRRGRGIYLLTDDEELVESPRSLYFSRSETPFYLYWSPDSRQVSFLANVPGNTLGLHLVSVLPGNDVRLLATGSPFYWDWDTTSDQILIHSGFSGAASKLALLDTSDAGGEEEIAPAGFFQAPGVSVSGRYLAYAEEITPGLSELTVVDRDSDVMQRERHVGLVAMGWNPARDQLAIISSADREDQFFGPLRLIDAQSGETTLLSRSIVLAFFWSPNGRYLAVISTRMTNDDLRAQLQDTPSVKIPAKQAKLTDALQPTVTDALQQRAPLQFDLSIVDVDTGQNRYLYPFEPTRVFLSQFLPFFDQYALSHQLWSPRSDALVLPMRSDGTDTIFIVYTNGDHPQPLADGNMPFWSRQ